MRDVRSDVPYADQKQALHLNACQLNLNASSSCFRVLIALLAKTKELYVIYALLYYLHKNLPDRKPTIQPYIFACRASHRIPNLPLNIEKTNGSQAGHPAT